MDQIEFNLWIEDFSGNIELAARISDYEEAQEEGMSIMNKYRNVRAWHITIPGQSKPSPSSPIPSSLERWHEFNERVPV